MKLLPFLVSAAVAATVPHGATAAFCSSEQLSVASSFTTDTGLLRACPTMADADLLTGVAPCADSKCVTYLSSLSARLPDCDVDVGKTFKDLYAAFVSVCQENALKFNATNATTEAPDTNSTKAPSDDTVGSSSKPAVPAPAPDSRAVRPTLVGVGAVSMAAIAMALVA